jgi:hypothetical protein
MATAERAKKAALVRKATDASAARWMLEPRSHLLISPRLLGDLGQG